MQRLLSVLVILLCVGGVSASQPGGVVYLHDPDDTLAWSPLLCSSPICQEIQGLVLPRLFSDETVGLSDVGLSTGQDTVLASRVDYGNGNKTMLLTLRDDLRWEDGTPVTAYDAFYTFLTFGGSANGFGSSAAFLPLDATTLLIEQRTLSCVLYNVQMTILPAHALDAAFATQAAGFGFTADKDASEQLAAWLAQHPWNAQAVQQNPWHITMPITLMGRDMAQVSPGDFLEVQLGAGQTSVGLHIYSNLPTEASVNYFLAGQLDVLRDAPRNRWADLAAFPHVKLVRQPTEEKAVLIFNLTDPNQPAPYKDPFDNLLKQVPHPILSDLKVRQAIAAAVDVNQMIEVGLNGYGIPTNETFAANTDLTTPDVPRFDPDKAERLLTEAGWLRSADGVDPVRRCHDCATAEENAPLSLTIAYQAGDATDPAYAIVNALREQMARVGIELRLGDTNDLRTQQFDIAFVPRTTADAELAKRFITQNDGAENVSSYTNPAVDALLTDVDVASATATCDRAQIQDRYAKAELKLSADLPEMTLFAYEDVVAVRDWVLNTDAIRLFNPLLHADQWQVYYGPQVP